MGLILPLRASLYIGFHPIVVGSPQKTQHRIRGDPKFQTKFGHQGTSVHEIEQFILTCSSRETEHVQRYESKI